MPVKTVPLGLPLSKNNAHRTQQIYDVLINSMKHFTQG